MDYFAGLDISMDETHVCVLDREGEVVRERSAPVAGVVTPSFEEFAPLAALKAAIENAGVN